MIGFVSKNVYIFRALLLFRVFYVSFFRNVCVTDRLRQQEYIYFPSVVAFCCLAAWFVIALSRILGKVRALSYLSLKQDI
jgi:hypothetical protein